MVSDRGVRVALVRVALVRVHLLLEVAGGRGDGCHSQRGERAQDLQPQPRVRVSRGEQVVCRSSKNERQAVNDYITLKHRGVTAIKSVACF